MANDFGRVEFREMLADDFVRGITLDALGAGIPGSDETVLVQKKDRVILDTSDQIGEVFLDAAQLLRRGRGADVAHFCLSFR